MADPIITQTATSSSPATDLAPDQQTIAANANIPAGQPGSPWTQSPVIPAGQISAQPTLTFPTITPTSDASGGIVASAGATTKSIADYIKEITPPQTSTSKQYDAILSRMGELLPETAGRGQAQLQAEDTTGASALKRQLADLNAQILTRSAEFDKAYATAETNNVPMPFIQGTQAAIRRAQASEIGLLQSRGLGLQGQYQVAQETANRAVDLKYSAIQDELNIRSKQLELIQPLLDKEEKTYAAALSQYYKAQDTAIQDKKDRDKQINDIMIEAAKYGADTGTLSAIQNSKSVPQAISAGSKFLAADYKNKISQQDFDNSVKMAQLQKGKYTVVDSGLYDSDGNPIKAVFNQDTGSMTPLSNGADGNQVMTPVWQQQFPDGSVGGQCGTFSHEVCDGLPSWGDTIKTKQAAVNKAVKDGSGALAKDWKPQVGDAVIFNYGQAGHVGIVNAVLPDGKVQLTESNFHQDGTITNDRVVSTKDANIYGAVRGQLKNQGTSFDTKTNEYNPQTISYAQQYASTGAVPAGIKPQQFAKIAQAAKELPKEAGTIVDRNTGVKPQGDSTKINAMADLYSVISLSKQLKELDQKRIGGLIGGTLGKVFGSSDQARYLDLRNQIVDLLSRARSGAALSVTEEKRYSGMLPGRFSEPFALGVDSQVKIDNFISNLTSDLTNKTSSLGWSVYGLTKVSVGDKQYTIGDMIQNSSGQSARVNSDGSLTLIK